MVSPVRVYICIQAGQNPGYKPTVPTVLAGVGEHWVDACYVPMINSIAYNDTTIPVRVRKKLDENWVRWFSIPRSGVPSLEVEVRGDGTLS